MKGRTLKANFFINVFGAIFSIAIALVTVPIYVRHIGNARYGVLSIVWVLLGYFGFLDLGLSRAATIALARLRTAPHEARASVLITTLVLNLGLGLFGSLCLAVFGSYLLQHVLNIPEALRPEIGQAFPWIVGLVPLALVSGVGIGAMESREQFLLANILQVCGMSFGQIVPAVLAVLVSPTLTVVIPAAFAVRALTVSIILLAVYRNERPLSFAAFDRHQAKKLLGYGGWISVSGVTGPVLTSLDQIVIGSMLNVAAVAHYAVPMNLVSRSQIFAGALSRTLFPRMSSVGPDEARDLASRALHSLAYGYSAICAPAIVLTSVFLKYWISVDFASVAAPVAKILFFGAWINGLAFVPYEFLQSQGHANKIAKFHIAEIFPFIAILWVLTSAYGITGTALAWSLRNAADAACLFWATGMPKRVLLHTMFLPLLLLVGSAIVAPSTDSSLWAAFGTAAVTGLAAFALTIVMAHDLRSLLVSAALRVVRPLRRIARAEM
jgi:O-antigen/teichoic acid export membrane protein